MTVRISFLIENTSDRPDLKSEAGLSVLVERDGFPLVFDTGLSGAAVVNAAALGIDLGGVRTLALSHGHVDHTGGLPAFLEALHPGARVHAHPAALQPKFTIRPGKSASKAGVADPDSLRPRAVLSAAPTELAPGITLTGEVPRITDIEDTGGPFFLDDQGKTPDPLLDDQSLIVDAPGGPVVLTGCAHAGIINILHAAADLTGSRSFRAVIGGLHMGSATPERIARTVEALADFEIACIGPVHCSGKTAADAVRNAYGGSCIACPTGTLLEF